MLGLCSWCVLGRVSSPFSCAVVFWPRSCTQRCPSDSFLLLIFCAPHRPGLVVCLASYQDPERGDDEGGVFLFLFLREVFGHLKCRAASSTDPSRPSCLCDIECEGTVLATMERWGRRVRPRGIEGGGEGPCAAPVVAVRPMLPCCVNWWSVCVVVTGNGDILVCFYA